MYVCYVQGPFYIGEQSSELDKGHVDHKSFVSGKEPLSKIWKS